MLHVQRPDIIPCSTTIEVCNDLVQTTTDEGELEFLVFYLPNWLAGEGLRITSLHAEFIWPAEWQCVWADGCRASYSSFTDGVLDLLWLDEPLLPEEQNGVFLVARIIMNVNGAGRLDFAGADSNPVGLIRDGQPFISYAEGCHAEAGMGCEYMFDRCAHYPFCQIVFDEPELVLTAPVGGEAAGDVGYSFPGYCPWEYLEIDTLAEWATAEIDAEAVHVLANATGLSPGVYDTSVRLTTLGIRRCLPVVFIVEETASVPDDQPSVRRDTWGSIKSIYRD